MTPAAAARSVAVALVPAISSIAVINKRVHQDEDASFSNYSNTVSRRNALIDRCQIYKKMSFLAKLVGGQATSAAKSASRSVAKDRLSVILASQRGSELLEGVCMEELQKDVLRVVEVRVHGRRTFGPLY